MATHKVIPSRTQEQELSLVDRLSATLLDLAVCAKWFLFFVAAFFGQFFGVCLAGQFNDMVSRDTLAGEKKQAEAFRQLAAKLGIEARLTFLIDLQTCPACLKDADRFIVPDGICHNCWFERVSQAQRLTRVSGRLVFG